MASTSTSNAVTLHLKGHNNARLLPKLYFPWPQTTLNFSSSSPFAMGWTSISLKSSSSSSSSSLSSVSGPTSSSSSSNTVNEEEDDEIQMIKRLQYGSDIIGVALPDEWDPIVNLTPEAVEAIAESFGEWLAANVRKAKANDNDNENENENANANDEVLKVSVGRDSRLTGPTLTMAVFAGLERAGCVCIQLGLATTPACFMSTVMPEFSYDGSVMITASDLPYNINGLKFFTKRGGLTSLEVEEICDKAAHKYVNRQTKVSTMVLNSFLKTHPFEFGVMTAYSNHLCNIIKEGVNHPTRYDQPLYRFHIIVNAGDGSGGFFTTDVLKRVGASTLRSLHLDPDGLFQYHDPNPEDEIAIAMTREGVLSNVADLGIVFDADVGRCSVIDKKGNPIYGDKLIALMSAIVLREHPGTTIVTNARTSIGLSKFITSLGGKHCLYRVGYRNVIGKGVQLNKEGIETHLMMETSGHCALKENYFLNDGAYMAVKIIIEMVRMKLSGSREGIGSLIKTLEEPLESVEFRMNVVTEPRYAKAKAVEAIQTFREYVEGGRLEGWELDSCGDCWLGEGYLVDLNVNTTAVDAHMYRVKVLDKDNGEHGWVHVMPSVDSPSIALNLQSSIPGGCKSMSRDFMDKFVAASGVDKYVDASEVERFASSGNLS